jgi:hypothetical protein
MIWIERTPVAVRALAAHVVAAPITLVIAWTGVSQGPAALALIEGVLAAGVTRMLRLPGWWVAIQFAFVPLAAAALTLDVNPRWYLAAFALLALVFGAIHASRVPLFLSGDAAMARLIDRIPANGKLRFFDAGCGIGSVLRAVGRARPQVHCEGVEAAPLPWLIAVVRGRLAHPRYRVRYASLWRADLGVSDIVYAYLSPAAMPRFWMKAKLEMTPGSLLISNTFPAPDSAADEVLLWGESPEQALFVYRM